ncbi:MAG: hypothetical protein Q8O40_03575 [Chloroflexota bacterium]|nr:hypothetical protein [Chloroflexota bacterium]
MKALKLYDFLGKRALVTRESARAIGPVIAAAIAEGRGRIELDFFGVDAITPSFLDEVLAMIDQQLSTMKEGMFDVIVLSPPTRLSSKFEAVGRSYGLTVSALEGGSWRITKGL